MKHIRCKFLALIVALITMMSSAGAATTYSYTGNNFFSFEDDPLIPGQYDTTHNISGWFRLADPLAPNTGYFSLTSVVLAFSFSDGRNVLASRNASGGFGGIFTDRAGNIEQWHIVLQTPAPTVVGGQQYQISTMVMGSEIESGSIFQCVAVVGNECVRTVLDEGGRALFTGSGGTWTVVTDPVPLPAALWLLLSAVGVLAARVRHPR